MSGVFRVTLWNGETVDIEAWDYVTQHGVLHFRKAVPGRGSAYQYPFRSFAKGVWKQVAQL